MKSLTETAIRSRAARKGWTISKSRSAEDINNHGHYMLADEHNCVVAGQHFDATLAVIAGIIDADEEA